MFNTASTFEEKWQVFYHVYKKLNKCFISDQQLTIIYRWHLILTKFSVFWQRAAGADKQNCWKLHSLVRFVHSFVQLSSWCWQINFSWKNCTALCYLCTALCYYHLDGENITFLTMPEITAGDCNVLDSGWL